MRKRWRSAGKIATSAAILLWLGLFASVMPGTGEARADSARALLEYDYNTLTMESLDKSSNRVTQTDATTFGQKYHLDLDKNLFPNLRLSAGGIFEKQDMDTTIDGLEFNSQRTTSQPYADLTLDNQLYRAGLSYNKRETEQKSNGIGRTNVSELYSTIFGWRPDGLPSVDLRVDKNDLYDKDHLVMDTTTTSTSMICRYNTDKFDFQYRPFLQDTVDRFKNYEIKSTTQNGRLGYSDNFFNHRTTFGATYNIVDQQQEIISHGAGELFQQITQIVAGLFEQSDSLTTVSLLSFSSLIDGLFTATTVNIGTNALPVLNPPARNMGLDFGIKTEVNTLRVWIDKDIPSSAVSDWFTWEIYTSDDNTTWQFDRTVSLAPFNSFQKYFEIIFPSVTARYIKVVVRPLRTTSASPDSTDSTRYGDIYVTELQAYVRSPLPDGTTKNSTTSHRLNMDARTRLMDTLDLFHDVSFFLSQTNPGLGERTTLSNALSINQRFSPILSGSARVLRDDINELSGAGVGYGYNAALRADPLQTLSNTLLYSGRQEKVGVDDATQDSLFLQNRAALYKGIDAFFDGGLTRNTNNVTGEKRDSVLFNLGTNVVPHRTMTLTGNYSETTSTTTGGPYIEELIRKVKRMDVGFTYRPFQTVYMVASLGRAEQETRNDTLKNYSLNWSPFPYGTLQLQFDYSEDLSSSDQSKITIFRPGIRWAIAPKVALTVSYFNSESDSVYQAVNIKSLYANLKIMY